MKTLFFLTKQKILLISITIACLLNSCGNSVSNHVDTNSEKNAELSSEVISKLESIGFVREYTPYIAKNKIEQNIISQMGSYINALLRLDFDNATNYVYKDIITYLKKFYPGFTIKDFFEVSSEPIIGLQQISDNLGLNFNVVVSSIDKIIERDNVMFCSFGTGMLLHRRFDSGKEYNFYQPPTRDHYTIGVSFDKGKNWSFVAKSDDTPNILRMRFSNKIISEIMGY